MSSTLYAKDAPPRVTNIAAGAKAIRRAAPAAAVFLALCLVPVAAHLLGQPFWLALVARIMILGLAAVGLNLVLGYGGMVSLGHAMYLGIGAYSVGILSAHGVDSGLVHLAVALAVGAAVALVVGLICLKTSGMAFIMITLAFAQMFYFLAISLKQYGGDDGLTIALHSRVPGLSLDDPYQFYLLVLAVLAAACALCHRLVGSRFGMVLRGSRQNPRRMQALGFPILRYRLAAYVLSAMIVVVAGVRGAGQPGPLRLAFLHELDPVGRSGADVRAGRHGDAAGADRGGGGLRAAGGVSVQHAARTAGRGGGPDPHPLAGRVRCVRGGRGAVRAARAVRCPGWAGGLRWLKS